MSTPMTSRDAIEIVADFLDQTLAPDALESLQQHLRSCQLGRAYLTRTSSPTSRGRRLR